MFNPFKKIKDKIVQHILEEKQKQIDYLLGPNASGGLGKRIDEFREIAIEIANVPGLLEKKPWIKIWVNSTDQFLVSLLALAEKPEWRAQIIRRFPVEHYIHPAVLLKYLKKDRPDYIYSEMDFTRYRTVRDALRDFRIKQNQE